MISRRDDPRRRKEEGKMGKIRIGRGAR